MARNKINYILLLFFVIIFISKNSSAQEHKDYKKNTIYVSYANLIFVSQASLSYERLLLQSDNNRTKLKLGFGKYLNNNYDYETNATVYESYLSLSAVQMLNIIELNGGIAYTKFKLARGFNPDPDIDYNEKRNKLVFYGNVGLRYVRENFIIRGGIGNLELLYVGIGINI